MKVKDALAPEIVQELLDTSSYTKHSTYQRLAQMLEQDIAPENLAVVKALFKSR
jgi:hypothetical protein